jgi:hypothetical protein
LGADLEESIVQATPCWDWTSIRTLEYADRDLPLRDLVALLPAKTSDETTIVTVLVELRARFQGWLHQDEFGPCRKDQTAALRALVTSFKRLQQQLIKAPSALKTVLDRTLRDSADPTGTFMQVFYEASADLEWNLRTTGAHHRQVASASRLKHCTATLEAQLQSLDTNTDNNIFDVAVIRGFDRSQAAGECGLAEVERWLNGYWNVLLATLNEMNRGRGADKRVSLMLLVDLLCQLWERETGDLVTANGQLKDEYKSRAETSAGRFVTAAVEAMLPKQVWFDERAKFARSVRARTFLPLREVDRGRQVLVIMRDFVRRRSAFRVLTN